MMSIVKQAFTKCGFFGQGFTNRINNAFRIEFRKPSKLYKGRLFSISTTDQHFRNNDTKLFRSPTEDMWCKWCNKPRNIKCRYAYTQKQDGEEAEILPVSEGTSLDSTLDKPDRRMILLKWEDGQEMLFPYIFLRDSCQCETCFHPFTQARLILMRDLKLDSFPMKLQIDNDNQKLLVTWDDGHVSPFKYSWLNNHSFTEHAAEKQDNLLYRKPTLWGKDLQDKYPTAEYNQLLTDDRALYQWLTDIEEFGFCLIKNAAKRTGEVERITKHVSFHRTTHYGPTFNVRTNPKPSNLAYTAGTLGLHTDIPYDRHPPGVQFLHCIKQTECEGGENQFSDSFYAADILKKQYLEYYNLLCTAPINFIDIGADHYGDFFKLSRHPIFTRDVEGNVVAIQCANQTRDSYLKQPVDMVEPTIRALKKLDDVLYENHIRIKMEEGDIASFGNRRVLHGRTSYSIEAGASQERYLQGTYIDLDEVNSRRRVLKQKLNMDMYQY